MPAPTPEQTAQAQARAIYKFRVWADDPAALIVDTETTGLEGRVWEFAAVRVSSPAPVLAFICDPDDLWSEKAAEMHAGRMVEVGAAPHSGIFEEVTGEALRLSRPLSYGGEFDSGALARTFPGVELPAFGCILTAYAPLAGRWSDSRNEWKFVSLSDALELERVDTRGLPAAHTAYGDALRAALLVQAVAARETDSERQEREYADDAERQAMEWGEELP